jgi:hypothetical protein
VHPRHLRASLAFALFLAVLLPSATVRGEDGPDTSGPPAFVPLLDDAAGASIRDAREAAEEGRADAAAVRYQAILEGPSATRLVPLTRSDGRTLEQVRERCLREMSRLPDVLAAWRRRHDAACDEALANALRRGDRRMLRQLWIRSPLASAGARAGIHLAREEYRLGNASEALGILDRLFDLWPTGDVGGVPRASLHRLQAAAARLCGEEELFAVAAAGADVGGSGGGDLVDLRALPTTPPVAGPRGLVVRRWTWKPEDSAFGGGARERARGHPLTWTSLPAGQDHMVAVRDGVVYWTDRHRVTAISLVTGKELGRSLPVSGLRDENRFEDPYRGESFAPAADEHGIVTPLNDPQSAMGAPRVGTLRAFDRDIRLIHLRGGRADPIEAFREQFVFHGRPLIVGDRVYVSATATGVDDPGIILDVRSFLMCFRRSDLEPLWATFLCYAGGVQFSSVGPGGSPMEHHGRLYVTTNTGLNACVDARSGEILWARLYRVPEPPASASRFTATTDGMETPLLWPESPPVVSGGLVAFAPRNSYEIEFCLLRPHPLDGTVLASGRLRPRLDRDDLTVLWVLPGPGESFFLAGKAGPEGVPLLLRDLAAESREDGAPIRWRGALMEDTVVGLPARTADAVYAVTDKALYRVPYPGKDGGIEILYTFDPALHGDPAPGNLVIAGDRILSVSEEGILCFGPKE